MKFPLCRILPPKKEKIQKQHNVSPQKSFKLMLPYFHMYCSCAVLTMPEGTCCGRFCKKCIKRDSACCNELTIHPEKADKGNVLIPLLQTKNSVTERLQCQAQSHACNLWEREDIQSRLFNPRLMYITVILRIYYRSRCKGCIDFGVQMC